MLNDVTFARARRGTLALLILGAALTLVPFDLTAQAPRTAAAPSAEAIERAKIARRLAERQAERAVEEQVRAVEERKRAVDEQKRAVDEQKLDEQLKRAGLELTTRSLREQLRVLTAQQERTERTMRELSLQLEQLRQQLERTEREVTIPPGSARPF